MVRSISGLGRTGVVAAVAILAVTGIGAALFLLPKDSHKDHDHAAAAGALVYVCPMHPWITSDAPGRCTVCGMSLVGRSPADAAATAMPAGTVKLSSSQVSTIGVETAEVALRPLKRTLRVNGRIEDDDTNHRIVSARVTGRIEKLNIKYVGEGVVQNETVATIFSADVLSAQRAYLERTGAQSTYAASELAAARERLLQLGLSDADIAELERTRQPSAVVAIRSPASGTVIAKFSYEGQYVDAKDRLFELADFSKMWFMFDAYEQDVSWLQAGQMVEVISDSFLGERAIEPIQFVDPNFNMMTRTTKVRVVLSDPHFVVGDVHVFVSHGILAQGIVHLPELKMITVPRSAVLDTGGGPVVYVDIGMNVYQQRRPMLGRRGDQYYEVITGLSQGEKVVTRGSLMIDAQAQLAREAEDADNVAP